MRNRLTACMRTLRTRSLISSPLLHWTCVVASCRRVSFWGRPNNYCLCFSSIDLNSREPTHSHNHANATNGNCVGCVPMHWSDQLVCYLTNSFISITKQQKQIIDLYIRCTLNAIRMRHARRARYRQRWKNLIYSVYGFRMMSFALGGCENQLLFISLSQSQNWKQNKIWMNRFLFRFIHLLLRIWHPFFSASKTTQ